MNRQSLWYGVAWCAVLMLGVVSASVAEEFPADARPSQDYTLSFQRSGKITALKVKEGDTVKKGQLLAKLDDSAEQAKLETLQAQAKSEIRIKAAEAQLDQKKVDLKRFEDLAERGAATDVEVQHARLEVKISRLSVDLYKFQHDQDARAVTEAKLQLEKMKILAPADGTVEQIHRKKGEAAEALEKVIRVVNVDPLWVDVYVPVDQARLLKCSTGPDDINAKVRFDRTDPNAVDGRIIHCSQVATGAIPRTLRIRVEVPNEDKQPAGQRVLVSFPAIEKATQPVAKEDDEPTLLERFKKGNK
jgi:RND family efflux transporter MFP subunit